MPATLVASVASSSRLRSSLRARRIADHAGRAADDDDRAMPGELHALEHDRRHEVADVQARRGRIVAGVHRDRRGRREQLAESCAIGALLKQAASLLARRASCRPTYHWWYSTSTLSTLGNVQPSPVSTSWYWTNSPPATFEWRRRRRRSSTPGSRACAASWAVRTASVEVAPSSCASTCTRSITRGGASRRRRGVRHDRRERHVRPAVDRRGDHRRHRSTRAVRCHRELPGRDERHADERGA